MGTFSAGLPVTMQDCFLYANLQEELFVLLNNIYMCIIFISKSKILGLFLTSY